jgi:hypothetical protein
MIEWEERKFSGRGDDRVIREELPVRMYQEWIQMRVGMYGVEAVGGLKGCGGSRGGDRMGQVGTGRLVDRFGDGESVNLVW